MKILLVDVDGTLLNMPKLYELINQKFLSLYPHLPLTALEKIYRTFYSSGNIDLVVEAGINHFDDQFWKVFYDIDFNACLDHEGWDALSGVARQKNISLHIFSQGSLVSAPSLPSNQVSYQVNKINRLKLGLTQDQIHIYQNKVLSLPELLRQLNPDEVACVDDRQDLLDQVKAIDPTITTYLITSINQRLMGLAEMLK